MAQVWTFRADCFFTLQDYASASKDLETARTLDPSHPHILGKSAAAVFALGLMDVYAGRFDAALNKLNQAIQWDDTVPEFYFERGRIYFYHLKVFTI